MGAEGGGGMRFSLRVGGRAGWWEWPARSASTEVGARGPARPARVGGSSRAPAATGGRRGQNTHGAGGGEGRVRDKRRVFDDDCRIVLLDWVALSD